jgi:hypothetical protein
MSDSRPPSSFKLNRSHNSFRWPDKNDAPPTIDRIMQVLVTPLYVGACWDVDGYQVWVGDDRKFRVYRDPTDVTYLDIPQNVWVK